MVGGGEGEEQKQQRRKRFRDENRWGVAGAYEKKALQHQLGDGGELTSMS